jgi:hypothetical protein
MRGSNSSVEPPGGDFGYYSEQMYALLNMGQWYVVVFN